MLLEPGFKTEFPDVAFATNRGRELGWGVPKGVVEVDGTFSGAFGGAPVPGALGTANLAKDTGLNVEGFLTDPVRA